MDNLDYIGISIFLVAFAVLWNAPRKYAIVGFFVLTYISALILFSDKTVLGLVIALFWSIFLTVISLPIVFVSRHTIDKSREVLKNKLQKK